jgi:hypothetical protein
MDRDEQLEKEIRLMSLDNILMEMAYTQALDKLKALYKDMRITAGVRMECYDVVSELNHFLEQGHESLRGKKDAAGNDIRI